MAVSAWSMAQRIPAKPGPAGLALEPVRLLEDVENEADRLVVGGVDADRPGRLEQQARDLHQLLGVARAVRQLGAQGHEVLEVACRPGEELAAALDHEAVGQPLGQVHVARVLRRPALEVGPLLARALGEEVARQPDRHLSRLRERLGAGVVLGEGVPAPARVDHRGEPEARQLAVEVPRGERLGLRAQPRQGADRLVEEVRVGLGVQHRAAALGQLVAGAGAGSRSRA